MDLRKRKLENEAIAQGVKNRQKKEKNGSDVVRNARQKRHQKTQGRRSPSLKSQNEGKNLEKEKKIKVSSIISENKESSEIKFKKDVSVNISENVKGEHLIKKSGNSSKSSNKKNDSPIIRPLKYESLGVGPHPVPSTGKKYVGCHVSAAGGIWTCFENGKKSNADAIAMFLRNQRSWNAKPLDMNSIKKWKETIKDFPRHLILPHGSYLMNLGSPKSEILEKSRRLLVEELQRCEKLAIPHFNFHPGSTLGEISREECCKLVAESINIAHKQTSDVICIIENMSKQGFTVGGDFHEIRLIIEGVEDKSRVGVCIDTCHAHAAGYDLASEKGFNEMVKDFEKIIGWQFLRGLHINDSKGKFGDHKDRHENIGKGFIGREGFRRVMNYPRFSDIPLILETPFVNEETYRKEIKLLQKLAV